MTKPTDQDRELNAPLLNSSEFDALMQHSYRQAAPPTDEVAALRQWKNLAEKISSQNQLKAPNPKAFAQRALALAALLVALVAGWKIYVGTQSDDFALKGDHVIPPTLELHIILGNRFEPARQLIARPDDLITLEADASNAARAIMVKRDLDDKTVTMVYDSADGTELTPSISFQIERPIIAADYCAIAIAVDSDLSTILHHLAQDWHLLAPSDCIKIRTAEE